MKNKKNILPCKSTFEICEISNKILSSVLNRVHESRFNYSEVLSLIQTELSGGIFFEKTNFDHNVTHRKFMVDLIVEEFIRIRLVRRARQITISQFKSSIRSAKTHDIHFSGQ